MNTSSKTRLMVLICRSHTPPKCDACGWLKIAILFRSILRYRFLIHFSNSDFATTKFVFRPHLRRDGSPQMAKNLRRAQINELESIASKTLMWIARLFRQVKPSPISLHLQLLLSTFMCVFTTVQIRQTQRL